MPHVVFTEVDTVLNPAMVIIRLDPQPLAHGTVAADPHRSLMSVPQHATSRFRVTPHIPPPDAADSAVKRSGVAIWVGIGMQSCTPPGNSHSLFTCSGSPLPQQYGVPS